MKDKKIIFKRLSVEETAEVVGAQATPAGRNFCTYRRRQPGEIPALGNCSNEDRERFELNDDDLLA